MPRAGRKPVICYLFAWESRRAAHAFPGKPASGGVCHGPNAGVWKGAGDGPASAHG